MCTLSGASFFLPVSCVGIPSGQCYLTPFFSVSHIAIMNPFASLKASSHHPLKIFVPKTQNSNPSRSIMLVFRPWRSSWKRLLRPSQKSRSFPDAEVLIANDFSSSLTSTLVESPTEEKCTSPKIVRFDDSPTYFYTKQQIKAPQSPTKNIALRSCLIVNNSDPFADFLSDDADDVSVYEDCLATYPGFFQDFEDLLEREHLSQVEVEKSRSLSWQLTEFGCTKMDRKDYLSECLYKHAEKKRREEIDGWRKVVYDHPMTLRWPSREIAERAVNPPPPILATPPRPSVRKSAPVVLPWHRRITSEITDVLVTLCIGLTIHMCIYTFGIYCFLSGACGDDED